MSDSETRRDALLYARDIEHHGSLSNLLENADIIERYLAQGLDRSPAKSSDPSAPKGLDFDRHIGFPPEDDKLHWSGAAQDLLTQINSRHTIILKARNIGFTTLMVEFAKDKIAKGKTVLWLTPTRSGIPGLAGASPNLEALTFREFKDRKVWEHKYDFIIVESLAFLPFSAEEHFIQTVFNMGKRLIFSSEAGQARGLFYDMWHNPEGLFSKIHLTYWSPLYSLRERDISKALIALGRDAALSEFVGAFRPVRD